MQIRCYIPLFITEECKPTKIGTIGGRREDSVNVCLHTLYILSSPMLVLAETQPSLVVTATLSLPPVWCSHSWAHTNTAALLGGGGGGEGGTALWMM